MSTKRFASVAPLLMGIVSQHLYTLNLPGETESDETESDETESD
jgi:hypothetical protein